MKFRKQSEADLYPKRRNQRGVTLVELLVVVSILSILGGITGIFLIKYLPEYRLRSAVNTLSQDLRQAQMGALKRMRPWAFNVDTGTHTYSIIDSGPDASLTAVADNINMKTVNLTAYDGGIRFAGANSTSFNAEGMADNSVTIRMTNSQGTVITTDILRTGAVRVTR